MLEKLRLTGGLALVVAMVSCGGSTGEPERPTAAEPSSEAREKPDVQDSEKPLGEETSADAGESQTTASSPKPLPGTPREKLMRSHFNDAELIRAAIIAGAPEKTAQAAYALVHMDDDQELPKNWGVSIQRLQEAAGRVQDASDVAQAAAATADIGRACGSCHQKFGGPPAANEEPPESNGSVASQMRRHAWATERLWEGLYVPSGTAWKAGATILADTELPEDVLKKGGVYARGAARDFSKIAAKARGVRGSAARAEVYAALLGTCAACHIAME